MGPRERSQFEARASGTSARVHVPRLMVARAASHAASNQNSMSSSAQFEQGASSIGRFL